MPLLNVFYIQHRLFEEEEHRYEEEEEEASVYWWYSVRLIYSIRLILLLLQVELLLPDEDQEDVPSCSYQAQVVTVVLLLERMLL